MKKRNKKTIVAVSGGFDPLHVGHVRMIQEAKKLGNVLVVILNNDNWLMKKKGFVFMPQKERKEIIESIKGVDRVVPTGHTKNTNDRSICKELEKIRPHIFANGGDRNEKDAADPNSSLFKDTQVCKDYDIKMIFNVGKGGKVQSSSWLTQKLDKKKKK